jgi:hypothetical protein
MRAVVTKTEIEDLLNDRFGNIFERYDRADVETLSTGVSEIDELVNGFPRGSITEIHGSASSGRTSLLLSGLASAASKDESCAVVDCSDTFDISSAIKAGVDFNRMLWVRCRQNLEHAFKSCDLILHSGGFGLVALNLSDVPAKAVRRIISSWWFRFRRAIEDTPTALIVLTPITALRSCATLVLEVKNQGIVWPSTLSLVSENRNGSFTKRSQFAGHLSLVIETSFPPLSLATRPQSLYLHSMHVSITRDRPVQLTPGQTGFQPRTL